MNTYDRSRRAGIHEAQFRTREHRVVVGLAAGNAESARTLGWAIAEAQASGAELVVVHATGKRPAGRAPRGGLTASFGGSMGALETVDRWAASAVAAARARLGEDWVRIDVEAGAPGEVLGRAAGPHDMVVIGAPQRSGWWVRGGTTYEVVTRARCPVIVVREPYGVAVSRPYAPAEHPSDPPTGAGEIGKKLRGQVVVGLDGTWSQGLLAYGFAFADSHGLPIAVVRAAPRADEDIWFDGRWQLSTLAKEPPTAAELAAEIEPWHHKYPHVPVTRAVLTGRPVDALCRASAQAALLVIGAGGTALHPLSGTCRFLVASADCPVAVIH